MVGLEAFPPTAKLWERWIRFLSNMGRVGAVAGVGSVIVGGVYVGSTLINNGGGTPTPPASGSLANVWVDDDGGTCTRSSSLAAYGDAAACASLAAAEDVDSPGDLVIARCDDESACTIQATGDTLNSSNASFVTYRVETGYTVTIGAWSRGTAADTLTIDGDKIIIEGFAVPHLDVNSTALDVVSRDISGSAFDVAGDNFVLIGGEWSYELCSPANADVVAQGPYFTAATASVVREVWFHDNDPTGCSTSSGALHTDCLQYSNMGSSMIERNKFGPHCGVGDAIIFGDNNTSTMNNGTVVNNAIVDNTEDAGGDQAVDINFSGDVAGNCAGTWYFRFNAIAPERKAYPSQDTSCDGIESNYGNIISQVISGGDGEVGDWSMIMSGVTTGAGTGSFLATPNQNPGGSCNTPTCGPRQSDLDAQFVNLDIGGDTDETTDSNLIAGSDAIDAFGGTASLCPDSDIDGHLRSGNCDIGADEYDSAENGDAPDWYVDDAGSDSNLCTLVFPCLTIDRAYDLAAAGDVIGMMAGTYADQTVTGDFAKVENAEPIVVQPVPGVAQASVVIGTDTTGPFLDIDGAYQLTVRGITANYWAIDDSADITIDNVDTAVFEIGACTDCTVENSDVGPYDTEDYTRTAGGSEVEDTQIGSGFCGGDGTGCPQDIIRVSLLNNTFHEYTQVSVTGDPHVDCLQFYEGEDVVIRGNKFDDNCGESNDMYIRGDAGPIDGFLIENNWSTRTAEDFSFRLSGQSCPGGASACTPPCNDVTIRNNTVKQRIGTDCTVTGTGIIRGNINLGSNTYHCSDAGDVFGTAAGWDYDYNVVGASGAKCDAGTDIQATPSFVSSTDLHLTGADTGADNALPSPFASTDIDGTARPIGAQADVGADER